MKEITIYKSITPDNLKSFIENNIDLEQNWLIVVCKLQQIAITKKINQNQIAEKTGLHQSNISRFFSMKHKPTIATLLLIANALDVEIHFQDKT